jgi:hypothetical protein
MATTIRCGCGVEHDGDAKLAGCGWVADGAGGANRIARCTCSSPVLLEHRADATTCRECRRLVTGDEGDVKIVTQTAVLCVPCHVRTMLRPILAPFCIRRFPA